MNTSATTRTVYHDPSPGPVFVKCQRPDSVVWLAVPATDVEGLDDLYVRHGNPSTGCGYRPLRHLALSRSEFVEECLAAGQRVPPERWRRAAVKWLLHKGVDVNTLHAMKINK